MSRGLYDDRERGDDAGRGGRSTTRRCLLAATAAVAGGVAGCTRSANDARLADPVDLQYGGRDRTYRRYVPDGVEDPPLVVVLHGGGGSARRVEGYTGYSELARREGVAVVYPDGVSNHWNDGRDTDVTLPHREGIDDVGFLRAVVEDLDRAVGVDRDRVYATGPSNGGMMSMRLACEAPGELAAIAPVIAGLPVGLDCSPSVPVSVQVVAGTDDPLVPYHGGAVGFGVGRGRSRGRVRSIPETVEFWRENAGCTPPPETSRPPDRRADATRVRRETYADCEAGATVELVAIVGGGHAWPGGTGGLLELLLGKTSREVDGARLTWAFFEDERRA